MKALSVQLAVSSWMSLSADAYNFQSASNGAIMWASGCDYYGNDIGSQPGPGNACGSVCVQNPQCTHFTWRNNVCYMKKATNPTAIGGNGVCGWVNRNNDGISILVKVYTIQLDKYNHL